MQSYNPLILIIDDVPENIQVLLQILEKEAFRFAIATNAEESFMAIEAEKPDLILLDVVLPQTNGYEICEKLKADDKTVHIPVIFLTVLDEVEDILKGFKLGAVDYITKPYNEYEVVARVSTQLKLLRTQNELRDINKTKDRLFSIIGHELKNPFNNILNFLDLILKNLTTYELDKIEELLKVVHLESARTSDLLENLLLWANAQSNKIVVTQDVFDLKHLVDKNLELINESAVRKGVNLVSQVPANLLVSGDKNMISTVLRNLLANAVKFTTDGKVEITARTDEEEVLIGISDTGTGISPENIDHIFDLEYRLTTKGTYDETGTGLGLILCKEFLTSHNKDIWVESEEGNGSTFFFTLDRVM